MWRVAAKLIKLVSETPLEIKKKQLESDGRAGRMGAYHDTIGGTNVIELAEVL